ncbi:MAG: hypothetical protein V4609_16545 [Pseudomonadota bacterium]
MPLTVTTSLIFNFMRKPAGGRPIVLVVASDGSVYLVPFVEQDDHFLLKSVIPSRKATRDYLNQGEQDAED